MTRVLILCLLLTGCGGPLSLLTGGGPNVAANVQAGAENEQSVTIGQDVETRQTITRPQARTIEQSAGKTGVRSEKIEALTINEASDGIPAPWDWILVVLALLLDSPTRWPGQIWRAIRGKRGCALIRPKWLRWHPAHWRSRFRRGR